MFIECNHIAIFPKSTIINTIDAFEQIIAKLKANREGIILGYRHLLSTNKRIGERLKLTGVSISRASTWSSR